jgi:hypothetical protein
MIDLEAKMAWYIAVAAVGILIAPFVFASHLRASTTRIKQAGAVWESVERAARELLEDRTLAPEVGDFVEFILSHTGSGKLTRAAIIAMFSSYGSGNSKLLHMVNEGQQVQLIRFMLASLMFDSLHTTFSGLVVRKWLYWLAATVKDRQVPVTEPQVEPVARAADRIWHSTGHRDCVPA